MVKSWGWELGGGERLHIDDYGNQTQKNVKGQSESSMPTFVGLPHISVLYILHDTWVTYKLLTLGQPDLALDESGMSLCALELI